MSGACFPVGRCTLLVHHHGISQPSPASWRLASSSQALSGPCSSHHRVVHNAEPQRLMEYLYTPRYCYISPLCFTAQRRLQVHDQVPEELGVCRSLPPCRVAESGWRGDRSTNKSIIDSAHRTSHHYPR